jgi:GTP cyclohydrolase II
MNHVTIIDTNYTTEDFTLHGFHMNSAGKEKLAVILGQFITNFGVPKTSIISLNWNEASSARPTKGDIVESITENAEIEHETAVRVSNGVKKIPTIWNEDFLWPTYTVKQSS